MILANHIHSCIDIHKHTYYYTCIPKEYPIHKILPVEISAVYHIYIHIYTYMYICTHTNDSGCRYCRFVGIVQAFSDVDREASAVVDNAHTVGIYLKCYLQWNRGYFVDIYT